MQGRVAMLRAVFGGEEKTDPAPKVSERPMTPDLFKALFGG